jgi:hypothetical protein
MGSRHRILHLANVFTRRFTTLLTKSEQGGCLEACRSRIKLSRQRGDQSLVVGSIMLGNCAQELESATLKVRFQGLCTRTLGNVVVQQVHFEQF